MSQETFNFTFGIEDFMKKNEGFLHLDTNHYEPTEIEYEQQLNRKKDTYSSYDTDYSKQLLSTEFSDLESKLGYTYNMSTTLTKINSTNNDISSSTATRLLETIKADSQFPSTDLFFGNELYQIASNSPSLSSSSSTNDYNVPPSSSISSEFPLSLSTEDLILQETPDFFTPQSNVQLDPNFQFDQLLRDSPTEYHKNDNPSPMHATSSTNYNKFADTPAHSPAGSGSITSTPGSQNEGGPSSRRGSLDSRLSLQKLGEILQTGSMEETIRVEKFVLNRFVKDLGFPLGYKTWIRDTNEKYRKYLLDELYVRVHPTYPQLTKSLLETIVKRATYSMMQGRLRKERRAASKLQNKKKSISK